MSNLTQNKALELKIEMDWIGYLDTKTLFSYSDAVNHLNQMLKKGGEWEWMLAEYPKATYSIWINSGIGFDKYGDEIIEKIHSITSAKIRKFKKLGLTF